MITILSRLQGNRETVLKPVENTVKSIADLAKAWEKAIEPVFATMKGFSQTHDRRQEPQVFVRKPHLIQWELKSLEMSCAHYVV